MLPAHLLATDADENLQQGVVQPYQVAGRRRVLPAAERGLRAERVAQLLIGDYLQQRVVAQAVGVVGVFVAGYDLVDALAQQAQRVVTDAILLTRITEQLGQVASQMMALIEGAQRQQTGVAGDLAARKIRTNGLVAVEGEVQLWYTGCHVADAPKRCAGFSENPVFMHLLEHPFLFGQQNQCIIQARLDLQGDQMDKKT